MVGSGARPTGLGWRRGHLYGRWRSHVPDTGCDPGSSPKNGLEHLGISLAVRTRDHRARVRRRAPHGYR